MVERIRRLSPRSSGWATADAALEGLEAAWGDDGIRFFLTSQYIVSLLRVYRQPPGQIPALPERARLCSNAKLFIRKRPCLGYAFGKIAVFTTVSEYLSGPLRSPRNVVVAVAAASAIGGVAWYMLRRPRPSAEELERARRDQLASSGRITDGSITDAPFAEQGSTAVQESAVQEGSASPTARGDSAAPPRQVIVYNYRIAGVTYEAAQDVTALSDLVRDVRTDLPVQVRYEPHNPANSIIVAETWSGLRLSHPHPPADHTSQR